MALFFKHLPVHQIFGANTNVGKTVITTALVRAAAERRKPVFYLKPVSTGALTDADDEHVKRYAGPSASHITTDCLFRYNEPVSPHLAARLANEKEGEVKPVPSDATFAKAIESSISRYALQTSSGNVFVETVGGVHSPTLSGTTQLDAYRPLFLPTILVGDSKLGGISTTISSYESLTTRGYTVDSVVLFRDDYYRNYEYLKPYFAERRVHVTTVESPPDILCDPTENQSTTEAYYNTIASESKNHDGINNLLARLDIIHSRRLVDLESMAERSRNTIWWPFVQHGLVKSNADVTVIDSAHTDFFSVHSPSESTNTSILQPQFDGSASWWTQTVGHSHPKLALAAARAAGRYGHVMFPQAVHFPALELAERLVYDGPGRGWAARAYYSDDGSTGMEIALKMAIRAYCVKQGDTIPSAEKKELGIIGLKGSYHGDTIGAMDACEEGIFTCEWHNAKGYWFDPPTVSIRKGRVIVSLPSSIQGKQQEVDGRSLSWVYDVEARLESTLASQYRTYITQTLDKLRSDGARFAALVLEPLVMGAGGMIFVDPLFQRVLIDVVRADSVPVIFDEVFVGLYRMGMKTTSPLLGANPDISVHAKVLTGGLVPMAITLASDAIYQAFMSDQKADALLHGHSYTAHAVGCEVANETLDMLEKLDRSETWADARGKWNDSEAFNGRQEACPVWSLWDPDFVSAISKMPVVSEVMTLGTVLAVKMVDTEAGYGSHSAQTVLLDLKSSEGSGFGFHYRTLGNVGYFMTSLNTSFDTIRTVEDRIWNALSKHQ